MKTKVTIYITNHNYGKYLHKSVNSCLNQSFRDFEILIIDDGSKDNSKSIINNFAKKSPLVTAIFQKNLEFINLC